MIQWHGTFDNYTSIGPNTQAQGSLVSSLIHSFYRLQFEFEKSWGRPGNEARHLPRDLVCSCH